MIASMIACISVLLFFTFFFFGFPYFTIETRKIDLRNLSDEELLQKVPYWRFFLVKECKAIEKATEEYQGLIEYFKNNNELEKNLSATIMFQLGFVATVGADMISNMSKQIDTLSKNPKKLKKYLNKNSFNKAVVELVSPLPFYYIIDLLKDTKVKCESKDWENILTEETVKRVSNENKKLLKKCTSVQ